MRSEQRAATAGLAQFWDFLRVGVQKAVLFIDKIRIYSPLKGPFPLLGFCKQEMYFSSLQNVMVAIVVVFTAHIIFGLLQILEKQERAGDRGSSGQLFCTGTLALALK